MKLLDVLTESKTSLLEQHLAENLVLLESVCVDLTREQRVIVEGIYNDFLPLIEASLNPQQIEKLFTDIEAAAKASGNRSLTGKAVDAGKTAAGATIDTAKKANEIVNKAGRWLQDTTPVKNFDAKFEKLKADISAKLAKDNPKVLAGIETMAKFAKENPGKTAAIIGVMTALSGLAGGPVGGAIAGQVLRGSLELLKGEKLSTAVGKGIKTAAIGGVFGALAGAAIKDVADAFKQSLPTQVPLPNLQGVTRWNHFVTYNGQPIINVHQDLPQATVNRLERISRNIGDLMMNDRRQAASVLDQYYAILNDPNNAREMARIARENDLAKAQYDRLVTQWMDQSREIGIKNQSIKDLANVIANTTGSVIQGAAAASGATPKKTNEKVELTEAEIEQLFEGIWDTIKKGASAVGQKIATAASNVTNKVTVDKMRKAWQAAGSPADSDQIVWVLKQSGVPADVIDTAMKSLTAAPAKAKKPTVKKAATTTKTTATPAAQPVTKPKFRVKAGSSKSTAPTAPAPHTPFKPANPTPKAKPMKTREEYFSEEIKLSKANVNKIFLGVSQDLAKGSIGDTTAAAPAATPANSPNTAARTNSPASTQSAGAAPRTTAAPASGKTNIKGSGNVNKLAQLLPNIKTSQLVAAVGQIKAGQAPSKTSTAVLAQLATELIKADPAATRKVMSVLSTISATNPK